MKEIIKNTTNSHVYNILFKHLYRYDQLYDKKNKNYCWFWKGDRRSWKRHRKTQYLNKKKKKSYNLFRMSSLSKYF